MKIEARCTNELSFLFSHTGTYRQLPKYKRRNTKSSTVLKNVDSINMTMPKEEISICHRLLIGILNKINKYYMPKGLPLKLLIC